MATTTATFTLTSTDLMANALNLSNTATLTTAGTTTGITETTGLARKKLASASLTDLITVANTDVTAAKSAKVYSKNKRTATEKNERRGSGDMTGARRDNRRVDGADGTI